MNHRESGFISQTDEASVPVLCINLCETTPAHATADDLEEIIAQTCQQAGFPYCERIYVGSYFCENYFLHMTYSFHQAVREICARHELSATLVVPIFGQAFLERGEERLIDVLLDFADVYDEVIVNDVAEFEALNSWLANEDVLFAFGSAPAYSADVHMDAELDDAVRSDGFGRSLRLGLGRLFSKELRDARYADAYDVVAYPGLSAEAEASLAAQRRLHPEVRALVEVDPVAMTVDVSGIVNAAAAVYCKAVQNEGETIASEGFADEFSLEEGAELLSPQGARDYEAASAGRPSAAFDPEIAIHLPYCYATTGRNCGPASFDEPESRKFRLGRGCSQHCLRMDQGCLTDEGVSYIKHGRAYYYHNPGCRIAGVSTWRIVYAAEL